MSSSVPKIVILSSLICISSVVNAQEGRLKKFSGLSSPEKRWVYAHPFIAVKALRISERAREISKLQESSPELDNRPNGGQVDAFRHCFWMASLCQQIKEKKALKLGVAHEEGNEKDFKKRKDEDGGLPDAVANTMDLWNNHIGAVLSSENPDIGEDLLIFTVTAAVTMGRCRIIKQNSNGEFLNQQGAVIAHKDWHGKWINLRCLVASDQTYH